MGVIRFHVFDRFTAGRVVEVGGGGWRWVEVGGGGRRWLCGVGGWEVGGDGAGSKGRRGQSSEVSELLGW